MQTHTHTHTAEGRQRTRPFPPLQCESVRRLNLPFTGAIVFCAQFVCCFIVVCVVPSICLSSSVCLSVFAESREYNRLFILSFRCFSFFQFGLVFAHSVCLCVCLSLSANTQLHILGWSSLFGGKGKSAKCCSNWALLVLCCCCCLSASLKSGMLNLQLIETTAVFPLSLLLSLGRRQSVLLLLLLLPPSNTKHDRKLRMLILINCCWLAHFVCLFEVNEADTVQF